MFNCWLRTDTSLLIINKHHFKTLHFFKHQLTTNVGISIFLCQNYFVYFRTVVYAKFNIEDIMETTETQSINTGHISPLVTMSPIKLTAWEKIQQTKDAGTNL